MISWIIVLWNWSPVATIALYFVIGFFAAGITIRYLQGIERLLPCRLMAGVDDPDSTDFIALMIFWLVFLIFALLVGGAYQACNILCCGIRWGARGFRSASAKSSGP